jgi:hypothetical protein
VTPVAEAVETVAPVAEESAAMEDMPDAPVVEASEEVTEGEAPKKKPKKITIEDE